MEKEDKKPDVHLWEWLAHDAQFGGDIKWCTRCGTIQEGRYGQLRAPHYPSRKELLCEDMQ
jgi:hypothetical protein